jgi:hypothetical protein
LLESDFGSFANVCVSDENGRLRCGRSLVGEGIDMNGCTDRRAEQQDGATLDGENNAFVNLARFFLRRVSVQWATELGC